jgi:hypothetical protein
MGNSQVRFPDVAIITAPGALAHEVTLQSYDISLVALDVAWKYRGLGLSTEVYLQRSAGLEGDGPLPISSTGALGGFVQGGDFV